jgi:hypothetical protein
MGCVGTCACEAAAAPVGYDQIVVVALEVAGAAVTAKRDLRPEASGDEQHKLLPCRWPAVAGKPLVPHLRVVE